MTSFRYFLFYFYLVDLISSIFTLQQNGVAKMRKNHHHFPSRDPSNVYYKALLWLCLCVWEWEGRAVLTSTYLITTYLLGFWMLLLKYFRIYYLLYQLFYFICITPWFEELTWCISPIKGVIFYWNNTIHYSSNSPKWYQSLRLF